MPSNLRLVLATKDANNFVQENLDDILTSQYGRHETRSFPTINTDVTITWPTTGETMCYIRFLQGASAYDVTIRDAPADVGRVFTVPTGSGFTPILIQQPKAPTTAFILKVSVVQPTVPMFFF